MTAHRNRARTMDMMQIAAAVVGSAAAAQHIPAEPPLCGKRTGVAANRCMLPPEHSGPCDCQVIPGATPAEGLDVHAALNTYEVSDGTPPGVTEHPHGADVVGSNGRRLLVRTTPEGVWIGGCEITDPRDLEHLTVVLAALTDQLAARKDGCAS